jgi:hypothetical protein
MRLKGILWAFLCLDEFWMLCAFLVLGVARANTLPVFVTVTAVIIALAQAAALVLGAKLVNPYDMYLGFFLIDSAVLVLNILADLICRVTRFSFFEGVLNGGLPGLLFNALVIWLLIRRRRDGRVPD